MKTAGDLLHNQYLPQTVSHPGETLREKLEELQMGPKEFAVRTGKPEKTISEVLNGNSAITPDMAVQFENVLKIPARFWLQRQYHYDEALARHKQEQEIEQATAWAKTFPYAQMAQLGWVPPAKSVPEKVHALFDFFGIAVAEAWEDFFLHAKLKTTFRISLTPTKTPHALSAWLRRGEIQAGQIQAPSFDEKKLKAALPRLKGLMAENPSDFFQQAQVLCLQAGVKVVVTPNLPKAPISGAARWVHDNPLIQLSNRYQRHDNFWFSFFHELGHILLHGKKDVFLEDIEYSDKDKQKEQEADDFAVQWTLPLEQEAILREALPLSDSAIAHFARLWGTHPGILVGRLQYRGLVPHARLTRWIERMELSVD
ncbi:MAG: HigA family addiction module antidote protein [Saprospiraceae bacterium]|nr:HigA family addiction module antidote protein [Saprospiraceae bacterium]